MIKFANIKNALGYGRVFYIPNTNIPAAAEITISRIGIVFSLQNACSQTSKQLKVQ